MNLDNEGGAKVSDQTYLTTNPPNQHEGEMAANIGRGATTGGSCGKGSDAKGRQPRLSLGATGPTMGLGQPPGLPPLLFTPSDVSYLDADGYPHPPYLSVGDGSFAT